MRRICVFLLAALLLLSGCSKGQGDGKAPDDDSYHAGTDYPYSMFTATTIRPIAETADGYYFFMPSFLFYMDKTAMEPIVVCERPNCMHYAEATRDAFEACSGYFFTLGASTIAWYDGNLYIVAQVEIVKADGPVKEYALLRVTPDGSRRTVLWSFGEQGGAGKLLFHRGKLYCTLYTFDENGEETSGIYAFAADAIEKGPTLILETEEPETGNAVSGLTAYANRLYFTRSVSDEGETELCLYDIRTGELSTVPATEDGYTPMWVTFQNGKMLVETRHFLPVGDPTQPEAYPKRLYRCALDGSGMEVVFDGQGNWTADERYLYRAPNLGTADSSLRIYDADLNEVDSVDLYDFLEAKVPGAVLIYASTDDQVMLSHFTGQYTDLYWFDKNNIGTGSIRVQTLFRYQAGAFYAFTGGNLAAASKTTAAATTTKASTAASTTASAVSTAATAVTTAPVRTSAAHWDTGSIEVEKLGIDLEDKAVEFLCSVPGTNLSEVGSAWEKAAQYLSETYLGEVTLTPLGYTDFLQTLRTRQAAGDAPDLFSVRASGNKLTDMARKGQILPLDAYIPVCMPRAYGRVDERLYELVKVDGGTYGILSLSEDLFCTQKLYYDKSLTDAAGITVGAWTRMSDNWELFYQMREWLDENRPDLYDTPVAAVDIRWASEGLFEMIGGERANVGIQYEGYETAADKPAYAEVLNIYGLPEFEAYLKDHTPTVTIREERLTAGE